MTNFNSPAILGQEVPDLTTTVIVRIVNQEETPTLKLVPMPGAQGPQGIQGPAGTISNVVFGPGLNYNQQTNTLSITGIDGGNV